MAKANLKVNLIDKYGNDQQVLLTSYLQLREIVNLVKQGKSMYCSEDLCLNLLDVVGVYTVESSGDKLNPKVRMELSFGDKVISIPFIGVQYFNRAREAFSFSQGKGVFSFFQAKRLPAILVLDPHVLHWRALRFLKEEES
jgi:hypothetical protein